MTPEILAVLVGSGCGAGGYLFREYQNRVRPYLRTVKVDGGLVKRTDTRPDTLGSLKAKIDSAYFFDPLGDVPSVGKIHEAWDRADDYVRFWPDEKAKLDAVLASGSKDALGKTLPELFSTRFLDRLMQSLLAGDRIVLPTIPDTAEDNVATFPGQGDDSGIIWLAFPQNTVNFGSMMDEEVMKAKAEGFLRIISSLDPALVHPVVQKIRDVGEKDFHISTEVAPQLKKMRDESSRWVLTVYFANLSTKPLMIHTTCKISVLDRPKRRFAEESYVVLIRRSKAGSNSYQDTSSPLIVRAGEDVTFAVITQKQQKEMTLGPAFREAFERGQGTCRVHLRVARVGLFGTQRLCTPRTPFKKSPTTT